MKKITSGTHIKTAHQHGIYTGNDQVIAIGQHAIEQLPLQDFWNGEDDLMVLSYPTTVNTYMPEEIIQRATQLVGRSTHSLPFNNSEEFACWCTTGKAQPHKVNSIMRQTTEAILTYAMINQIATTASRTAVSNFATMATPAVSSISSHTAIGLGSTVALGTGTAIGVATLSAAAAPIAAPLILGGLLLSLFD